MFWQHFQVNFGGLAIAENEFFHFIFMVMLEVSASADDPTDDCIGRLWYPNTNKAVLRNVGCLLGSLTTHHILRLLQPSFSS